MASLTYSSAGLRRTAERYADEGQRAIKDVFIERSRSLARKLLEITPPAGNGISGSAALERGFKKLSSDADRVFWVRSASVVARDAKRAPGGITVQLFATKTGRVYGTDSARFQPNASVEQMKAHHQQYFRNGRMTRAGTFTRDIGRWKFVEAMVVSPTAMQRYLEDRKRDVGGLMGGWVPLLQELGLSVPSWIADQQISGHARLRVTDSGIILTFANETPYAGQIPHLQRLVTYALQMEQKKLERMLPHVMAAAARKAGLNA